MAGRQCTCDPGALRAELVQQTIPETLALVAQLAPPGAAREAAGAAHALALALFGGPAEGPERHAREQFAQSGLPPLLAALAEAGAAGPPSRGAPGGVPLHRQVARAGGEHAAALFAAGHAAGCPACDAAASQRAAEATLGLIASLRAARRQALREAAAP